MIGHPIKNVSDAIVVPSAGLYYQVLFALPDGPQSRAVEKKDPVGDVIFRSDGFMTKIETKAGIAA